MAKRNVNKEEVLKQIEHLEKVVASGKAQTKDVTLIYRLSKLFRYRGEHLFLAPDAHKKILTFLNEIRKEIK